MHVTLLFNPALHPVVQSFGISPSRSFLPATHRRRGKTGDFEKLINMNCEIVRIYRKKYTKNKIEVMQQMNAENVLYREIKRCKVSCFKVPVGFAVCVDQVLKIKTSAFIRQLSSPLENVIKYSLNTRQVTS